MIKRIEAVVGCDHCGTEFSMDIDAAYEPPRGWSMFDIAVDSVRGGHRGRIGPNGVPSVQAGLHLCPTCTRVVDAAYPEDHLPSEPEIKAALS
jgi:hypothetical protein